MKIMKCTIELSEYETQEIYDYLSKELQNDDCRMIPLQPIWRNVMGQIVRSKKTHSESTMGVNVVDMISEQLDSMKTIQGDLNSTASEVIEACKFSHELLNMLRAAESHPEDESKKTMSKFKNGR